MADLTPEQRRRRVRLRDLDTLIAVVQAGGIRRAAAALHLSQPAVSKAMQELEGALGVRLLERGRRGVEVTMYGEALVRRARGVIDELHSALLELDWLSDPDSGEARVGGGDTQHAGVLAATVRQLMDRHPRMNFVLESAQAAELVRDYLPQRLVDLAVVRPLTTPLPADIQGEVLYYEHLRVVAGPGHPLVGRRRVRLSDLVDECWILSRNEVMPDTPVTSAFAAAGLPMPRRVIISGAVATRETLLAHGRYVTCVPHTLLHFVRNERHFRLLPVDLPPWSSPTLLMTLRGRTLSPAAMRFIEMLWATSRPLRLSSG
jgi:DNA-binding transcriptional LysR family regulator